MDQDETCCSVQMKEKGGHCLDQYTAAHRSTICSPVLEMADKLLSEKRLHMLGQTETGPADLPMCKC